MLLSNYTSKTFLLDFLHIFLERRNREWLIIKNKTHRTQVFCAPCKKHIADYTDVYINENIPYFPVVLCIFLLKLRGRRCFININLYK